MRLVFLSGVGLGCLSGAGPSGSALWAPWMVSELQAPRLQQRPVFSESRPGAESPLGGAHGGSSVFLAGARAAMKPVLLQAAGAQGPGGALAGRASPPALSPNLPSVVKVRTPTFGGSS